MTAHSCGTRLNRIPEGRQSPDIAAKFSARSRAPTAGSRRRLDVTRAIAALSATMPHLPSLVSEEASTIRYTVIN
ncbi:hypothetical protein RR46_11331 [Papilio xuthus]|uniref:Uncharacterized protein n=1 Tax=Papilio xuthus TaxID=66420 RepID=A0A194PRP0_PAPXU|nr:hypothetical protein RR46_11331 [Papilio xuthus]